MKPKDLWGPFLLENCYSYHSPSTCIDRIDLYNISHLSIYLFAYPSTYLSIQLSIHPAIDPYLLSSQQSFHLSIYIHPSMCLLFPVPNHHFFSYLYLSVHANFHLSSFMFIYLSTCLRFVAGKIPYMLAEVCSWDGYSVLNYHLFYLHIIGFSPKPRRSGLPTRSEQSETNGKVYVMKLVP